MHRFRFEKLVRDKILDEMIGDPDQDPEYVILSDEEYATELKRKLIEESRELENAKGADIFEEMGDVMDILRHLMEVYDIKESDINDAIKAKQEKRGGFKKKIYIKYVDAKQGSRWYDYYKSHPDKYPIVLQNIP